MLSEGLSGAIGEIIVLSRLINCSAAVARLQALVMGRYRKQFGDISLTPESIQSIGRAVVA